MSESLSEICEYKSKGGLKRIINAGSYSLKGLQAAWRSEAAFRQELVLVVILLPVAVLVDITTLERIALIATLVLLLIVELLNSAVEAAIDRIGVEKHELSGRAKDLGSAAVFLCLGLLAYVWLAILAHPVYLLYTQWF